MGAPASSSTSPQTTPPKRSKWSTGLMSFGFILVIAAIGSAIVLTRDSSGAAAITATVVPNPTTAAKLMRTILPAVASPTPDGVVEIYVTGAVNAPGLYRLLAGERISDAIQAAGGMTDDADAERVELAQRVRDEMHIIVPRKGQTVAAPAPVPASAGKSGDTGIVNVNTATQAELEALPGIGTTLAQRLIDYRSQNGPLHTLEDLRHIHGFTDHVVNLIKDRVSF